MESFHKSIWESCETEREWWQMIAVRISGRRACYTRPENKVERVSYPVITPSAAEGVLRSVYCKSQWFRWAISRIVVIRRGEWDTIQTNEIKPKTECDIDAADVRLQRRSRILRDVEYIVEALPVLRVERTDNHNATKHLNILRERLKAGASYRQPCLGQAEYFAEVTLTELGQNSPLSWTESLGWMQHSTLWHDEHNDNVKKDKDRKLPTHLFDLFEVKNGVIHVNRQDDVITRFEQAKALFMQGQEFGQ
jgi:CRISPR-associated protein Cas5d